MTKITLVGQRW